MSGRAHGSFRIVVEAPFVIVTFADMWNAELMPVLSEQFKAAVTKELLPVAPHWGVIADLTDFLGQPHEAFGSWKELLDWSTEHGQVAAALVGPKFFDRVAAPIEEARSSHVQRMSFKRLDEGRQWMLEVLNGAGTTQSTDEFIQ